MKAILFAVAGLFFATLLSKPSSASPSPFRDNVGMSAFGDRTKSTRKSFSSRKPFARHVSARRQERARAPRSRELRMSLQRGARLSRASERVSSRSGLGPRPSRWCGWWMRSQIGGGPELNLARNWKSWGRPSAARVGAVVVWNHHVGMITGQTDDGQWIIKSGNDGGRVRERVRSVKGAVFRI
jgi:hypothetical protein